MINQIYLKLITIGFLAIWSYGTFSSNVFAQQVSLAVYPPLLEVLIKPGKDILIGYKVQNLADPVILAARIVSFYPTDNKGSIDIKKKLEGPIKFNLENADIQMENPFFLKNNSEQQALLKIRVPENTPLGDYYYTLLFESKSQSQLTESASGAQATIGANILITVSNDGKLEINPKINQFDVLPTYRLNILGNIINLFESTDKIPVVLDIQNQGGNSIKSYGDIILKGALGETSKYDILPQNILAKSDRIVAATPSASFEPSHSLLIDGFYMGKYSLEASVNFGENTQILTQKTYFYSFPIKITLVLIISILIAVGVIKRTKNTLSSDN